MNEREAIAKLGGLSAVARRYGYSAGQVGNWARRGIPLHVLMDNKRLASALKAAGYERTKP